MVTGSPITTAALPVGALGWSALSAWQVAMLVAAGACAVLIAHRSYQQTVPRLSGRRRMLLQGMRTAALTLLLLLLLEPVFTLRRTRELDPTILLLVDDSASMSIPDVEGRPRIEAAHAGVRSMIQELEQRGPQSRVVIASGSRRVHLRQATLDGPARGEGTDLRALLVSAAQRHLEDNLRAIVLFSDGRDTQGGGGGRAVETPVFAVALGDSSGATDLRLDRVRYPNLVRRGDRLEISGEVVSEAAVAGSTRVELRRAGELLDEVEVSWGPDVGRQAFRFLVTADSLGWQRLELRALPLEAEVLEQNNQVQIAYEVQKDRLRVLYYESQPSWNMHFLRRFARTDPRFDFWVALRKAGGMAVATDDSTYSWPLPEEELADVDLFVAGSLRDYVELFTQARLPGAVSAGAGLWVLADGADGAEALTLTPEQLDLLPLRPRGRWRMTGGAYRAELTAAGRDHALFEFDEALGDVQQRLTALPPFGLSLGPADSSPDAAVLLRARSGPWTQPLLALREVGQGRVAFWTGAPLWPWSFWRLGSTDNEDLFRAFVDNLFSQLAEGTSRERLRLQLPGRVVSVGSEILARAVALDGQYRPDDSSEVWLECTSADSTARESSRRRIRMDLDPDSPGGRRAALPSLPPGDYRLRVVIEGIGEAAAASSEWTELSVDAYSVEYRNPRPDFADLRSLSEKTGGHLLPDASDLSWVDGLELQPLREVQLSRLDLYSSWWAFWPFLALVGLEWTLRRRWGLL